jgi:hypothetical protein
MILLLTSRLLARSLFVDTTTLFFELVVLCRLLLGSSPFIACVCWYCSLSTLYLLNLT